MKDNEAPLRMTVAEAARVLNLAESTLWRRIAAGKIAVVRDGKTFIMREEVIRYASEGAAA